MMTRKILLGYAFLSLVGVTIFPYAGEKKSFVSFMPKKCLVPKSIAELQDMVRQAGAKGKRLSVAGTRKSQGGQTADMHATMIDMSHLKGVIDFDKKGKRITVQTGITWRELLPIISTAGLSVKTMQSYCDFSVGGSLGVNAHGQDIYNCSISESVESIKIMMADGSLVEASTTKNEELFKLALGGYGLFGIITEVTLLLTDNMMVQRNAKVLEAKEYPNYFTTVIKNDKNVSLHSARLTVAPNDMLTKALVITYSSSGQIAPLESFVVAEASKKTPKLFGLFRNHEWVRSLRLFVEKNFIERPEILPRNKALSDTIENLKNSKKGTHDILQEYFIPCAQFDNFIAALKHLVKEHAINLLNVTVRYVKPTKNSFLTYATQEAFAFVLYINVEENERSYDDASCWTQQLIEEAIKLGGTYYLPYHLFAPRQQLKNAYPNFESFITLKKKYDPREIFINQFYRKYVIRR